MKQILLKYFTFLLLTIAGFNSKVNATHMMGADITYKCLGNNKYEITIKMYRDCRGVPIGAPGSTILCGGNSIASFTPTEIRVRDVTPTCAGAGKPCNPQNTYGTGTGVEEHTYTYTYDFTTAKKNGCCKVTIGTGQCCRNGAITTGAASQNFWTTAEIDICTKKCNSSPSLTSEPVAILCCNQPYFYNNGASDTTDFDSLSYSWDDPLQSFSSKTSWAGGKSSQSPFSDYWPQGYDKNKGPNPSTNPPIGTYLDKETGDIIFTPTDCSESTVASIKVTEWRKDTTGRYVVIGVTHRDIQFWVQTCPDNNPPLLYGPFKQEVCAGTQICWTIASDDKQFIPPPPLKPNPPDTVRLTWNRGIPGGTFTIIDAKDRLQRGRFCWTPKKNQASDLPYTFTVTARDNACPRNAVTVKSYSVKVKQIAETNRSYKKLICGAYAVESKIVANFKGTPKYDWIVTDSINKFVDGSYYYFKPSKSLKSSKAKDTIQFRKGGKYIITHSINNPPLNCPSTYFDTIIVPPLLEVDLALGPDSFVCAGTTLRLGAKAANGLPRFTYKWFTPIAFDKKDTNTYIDVFMSTHDTMFMVEITDDNKCTAFDTVSVFLKPNPKVDMGPDLRICWYGEVTLTPNAKNAYWVDPQIGDTLIQGDTLWWMWSRNGIGFSTDTTATFTERGLYTAKVIDSLGCNWTDSMYLFVNDTLYPNAGPDQIKCWNDTLILNASGLDTVANDKKGTYIWYRGLPKVPPGLSTKEKWMFKIQDSDNYLLELQVQEDTTRCWGYDTVYIKVNPLPTLTLATPQKFCCDYGNIALGSAFYGSPTGGNWSCRQNPSYVVGNSFLTPIACDPKKSGTFRLIYVYQEPTTSCINKDSTMFTINPLPPLMVKGGYYCQDKMEAVLRPHIVAPINLNSMVDVQWKVLRSLKKPSGGLNTVTDLIYDADASLNYDFRLKVDSSTIDIGSLPKDSLVFEITIQDGQGCFNKDTLIIFIWKVPVITFNIFPDLCIDAGKVDLKKISNVQPNDGCWTVIDTPGFKSKNFLLPGMMGCDSINTFLLNLQNGPGLYKMRYTHTASGCPVQRDTNLRINALPTVDISISPKGDFGKFCEIDADVTLNASPSGGTWSSSVPGVIGGGKFKPTSVPAGERDKWITLTYYYMHPTTKCDTSKTLKVFVQNKPIVDIITPDIDTCRSNLMNLTLRANYQYTSKINWVNSADPIRASFESNNQLSNQNPVTFTIRPRSDSATTLMVTCFTEQEGVCPFSQDAMTITIHPRPHAIVSIDDPDGCVPHTVNFLTKITNGVDSSKSKYNWENTKDQLTFSALQSPTNKFNIIDSNKVFLKISSEFGCDTLIGPMPILVYPLPKADFTPNPNNRTTAALPRFRFTNESTTKQLVLNSKIVNNFWNFGDLKLETDTSSKTNPEYYYTNDTGQYKVKLVVTTNHGCKDSIEHLVVIDPDILVFIPNVFTPDGSGPLKNDKFWVQASGFITYQILIFNRWGELLYEATSLDKPWDGIYKGEPCQMDAYVYHVNITSYAGELYKYNGTVLLIR